jgi:hypothetical protein
MRSFGRILLLAVASFLATVSVLSAQPMPSLGIRATYPGLDGGLGDYEKLFVRLAFRATQPVYLRIEGVAGGKPAPRQMSGGMHRAEPGAGEAVLWIAYPQGAAIDALRVSMLDLHERPISSFDRSARLQWAAGQPRSSSEWPEWAARAYAEQQRVRPTPPPTDPQMVGLLLLAGVPPLYFILQAWFGIAWTGAWRKAALVPLLLAAPAVLWSAHALAHDSNLAFLPVALMAPFGLAYLVIAALARTVAKRLAG